MTDRLDADCIFCSIITGDIPARKIYEDENTLAFLDIFPANTGHSLVIPKFHVKDIHDATADEYALIAKSAKVVADLLQAKLNPDGTTIFQMNKAPGWQTVFHAHMHVIPRWQGDSLHNPWDTKPGIDSELNETFYKVTGI
mgnify:FL=1